MTPSKFDEGVINKFSSESLPVPRRHRRERKMLRRLLILVAVVLLGNAVVGERGWIASFKAERLSFKLNREIGRLRRENQALRRVSHRLQKDPIAIESVARRELGLIKRGEILVVVP